MKRCFSIALILALLGTSLFSTAFAEELEIISDGLEAPVEEVDWAEPLEFPEIEDVAEAGLPFDSAVIEELFDDGFAQDILSESSEAAEDAASNAKSVKATAITLNKKSLQIGVDEKYTGLVVSALPAGSTLPVIKWRSNNKKIVKVSKKGVVTGVSNGSAVIYARISGSKNEVPCSVLVCKKPKKVTASPSSLTLSPGMTSKIKASVPSNYACSTYTFTSSKTSVATVDSTGLVTALKRGSSVITVSTYNGKTTKVKVTVKAAPASVAFQNAAVPLAVGESSKLASNAVTASGKSTPSVITYAIDNSSQDPDCIKLNKKTGKITGVRRGQAVVRGTAHNGAVGYCAVEVLATPAAIDLSRDSASIGVGEVYAALTATLTPPDGEITCSQNIAWASSNNKIAKVDPDTGIITGVSNGSCVIRASVPGGLYADCSVKVLKAPKSSKISISPVNGALKVGQTGQYKITFSKGYGGSLSYSSSNTEVATIDNSGLVTAISPGNATITVTTYNGVKKQANLEVSSDIPADSEGDDSNPENDEKIQYLIKLALQKQGAPYVYGAFGPNSFDCSGFVYWCYKQIGIKLKDSAYKQGYDDRFPKIAYADLKPGDLVFFNTVDDSDLSDHSGIYLGSGAFVHASSSARKVLISQFVSKSSDYYKRNFSWGRRVLN